MSIVSIVKKDNVYLTYINQEGVFLYRFDLEKLSNQIDQMIAEEVICTYENNEKIEKELSDDWKFTDAKYEELKCTLLKDINIQLNKAFKERFELNLYENLQLTYYGDEWENYFPLDWCFIWDIEKFREEPFFSLVITNGNNHNDKTNVYNILIDLEEINTTQFQ